MVLLNKLDKKFIKISMILLGIVAFLYLLFIYPKDKEISAKANYKEIDLILLRGDSSISLNPVLAENLAIQGLKLSTANNDTYNIVRSYLLLGKLNNLKGNQNAAFDYYNKSLDLSKDLNYEDKTVETLISIGEIIYKNGDYDKALTFFLKADSLSAANKFEHLNSYALYFIGKYHRTKGNFPQAKSYFLKSLALCRKTNDKRQLAILLPSLGKYYISEGKLNIALAYYQEAYYISIQLNDALLIADICNHLGSLYIELKEYSKAMSYHKQALRYRLRMNYPSELATSYNNVGKVYLGLNKLDSAKQYFDKSLSLCRTTNYKKGLVKTLVNLGEVNRIESNSVIAGTYLYEALNTATHIGYDNGVAEAAIDLGDLYRDKKSLDSAIVFYKLAYSKLGKTNYYDDLLRTYKGLYICYNIKKDYQTALDFHTSVLEMEKKLLDVENKRQLAILNITFDNERKEKDYQVLVKDNELKASLIKGKNILIWLIIIALCFTIVLCLNIYNRFYSKKKANLALEELNIKITQQNRDFEKVNKQLELVSLEKDKLISIIAHELRNPLFWLQSLTETLSQKYHLMSPEKIQKSLLSLDESARNVYHLMDNLLQWSRSKLNRVHPKKSIHNLNALVNETIQTYETFFVQKGINYTNKLEEEIYIYADADLFNCVIRNLVSNAIKYTPVNGSITLDYKLEANIATLILTDLGRGIDKTSLGSLFNHHDNTISIPGLMQEKGSGLGLKLCKDFVEMNGGKIWVESLPNEGAQFFFTVPIHVLQDQNRVHTLSSISTQ